jgi:hypothetical protein
MSRSGLGRGASPLVNSSTVKASPMSKSPIKSRGPGLIPYKLKRRNFVQGLGAGFGLLGFLRGMEAHGQPGVAPRRFFVIQHPVGTFHDEYWPSQQGADFDFSRILMPFEPLRERMIVLGGLSLPTDGGTGGGHERGTVAMVTGRRTIALYPGNGGDDPYAEGPSVDQRFVTESAALQGTAVASLQVSCDNRADTPEVSTRHLSYSGAREPMTPYYQAADAYERLFGTVMPGGPTDENMAALELARRQKQSVLDFALADLNRMRTLAPASGVELLDRHEEAIRQLEMELDAAPVGECGAPAEPERIQINSSLDNYGSSHVVNERDDEKHSQLGALHMAVIKAAFTCDLTRTVTFQWSPGTNHVSFGDQWPPSPSTFKVHHTTSHDAKTDDVWEFLTRIEIWYNERVSAFLQELAMTPDLDGTSMILDNTCVPYITEVTDANHGWNNMPYTIFGGPGIGLQGNQYMRANGTTNDMWMTMARLYGLNDFTFGEEDLYNGTIDGLFA